MNPYLLEKSKPHLDGAERIEWFEMKPDRAAQPIGPPER